MELILTQICLLIVAVTLGWTVHKLYLLKHCINVYLRKQMRHQHELDKLTEKHYPQPEDFDDYSTAQWEAQSQPCWPDNPKPE